MQKLNNKIFSVFAFAALLGITGCDSDNKTTTENPQTSPDTRVQIIHASPDAPKVDLVLDGNIIAEDVDYLQATPISPISVGSHTVGVKAILPDELTINAFDDVTADFAVETIYTILAVNNTANIEPLVLTRSDNGVSNGNVRLQIVHAAPNAPMVDVYATAPGADLAQSAPLVTAEFKGSLDATEVAAGDYQIRITLAGDPQTVVYDSGTQTLPSGGDFVVAAVTNTGPGSHPVNLVLVNTQGQVTPILHADTPAAVRVVHASPDAPAVDVIANDNFQAPLITNLAYAEYAGYVDLSPANYNVKVVPNGEMTPVVIDADLNIMAGYAYNVIATNNLASISPLVLTANNRRIATEAKLRIIHASPTASDVDLYLVAPNADISDIEPTLAGVPFLADTNFLSITPGSYDVVVTPAGTKDIAIGPLNVNLSASGIYSVIARDNAGGGAPLGVILLDDFAVTQ
ncbi:DUF4397 domain-containing protein [Aliikangiella sp. IMCC44359]|uniref:DUF4397 domain-containing protein n=1 Tax=Aliikangiella sp. IMCC44359 TaxID=3459125 RepID=UPI00403AFC15